MPMEGLKPHSLCFPCQPAICLFGSRCYECSHLSDSQFKANVDLEKHSDFRENKLCNQSSDGSTERRGITETILLIPLYVYVSLLPVQGAW